VEPAWVSDCGTATLYLGDCLEVLPGLSGLGGAIITDPPYGIAYQSARRTDKQEWFPKIANDKRPFVWWLAFAERVLHPEGCLLSFCRWDTAEAFRLAIGWAGLKAGAQIVWDRVVHGMGDPSSRPSPCHDLIWFAARPGYKVPGRRPKSVVRFPRLGGHALEHPNEKPVELMADLVKSYVHPGRPVLDPFMGSGTTLVAAVEQGRPCVGIELDPHHFEVAKARVQKALADRAAALPFA
jgi:site-specific DNA-methyltransferase (adenine-specific)